MSFTTALERPDSPTIDASLNERAYVRKLITLSNDYADGPGLAGSAPGVPRLFEPYSFGNEVDQYALCRHIAAERIQPNSLYWVVTCRYETPNLFNRSEGSERDQTGENTNPLLALPEIETSTEKFQEVIYAVLDPNNGNKLIPCQASTGEVYIPPPVKDSSRIVLTITRNEDINTAHPAIDLAYSDTVNNAVFWGCPAGQWKCQAINAVRETKQILGGIQFAYLKVTYKFEGRPTWDLQILDAGAYYLWTPNAAIASKKVAFLTDDGHPTTGPLNGVGGPLFPQPAPHDKGLFGDLSRQIGPPPVAGANPVFNIYKVYPRTNFGALNLPQSFAQVA